MRFSICRVLRVPALVVSVLGLAWSAQAGQLEKIRAAGEITIAHRNASIPFSYLDADGKPIGYAMDVCIKLADAIRRDPREEVGPRLVAQGLGVERPGLGFPAPRA